MDNLDKIRNGDIDAIRKQGGLATNLVSNAKNILSNMRQLEGFN